MNTFFHQLSELYPFVYFIFAFQDLQNSSSRVPHLLYVLVCKIHTYLIFMFYLRFEQENWHWKIKKCWRKFMHLLSLLLVSLLLLLLSWLLAMYLKLKKLATMNLSGWHPPHVDNTGIFYLRDQHCLVTNIVGFCFCFSFHRCSPIPNNSPPPLTLLINFWIFCRTPFLYLDPPPPLFLLIFQIFFFRYFRDYCKTVTSLVQYLSVISFNPVLI